MPVDRCICHKISFADIKRITESRGLTTLEQLRAEKICSTNCKLCGPYIKKLLQTGRTSFEPMVNTE
ncbi:(2Fe-2S)-binding protein [Rhodohalobacter sp. 614A]|uniref:(2Fe-2S)-binding protein n=1 Tax=Rhodohalobacter sp. 614A TaxID=2908649 RepID=UPI001F360BC2|nr:(2Fe-2S)-binding protein [Rhodohalobacter sp. 614A]